MDHQGHSEGVRRKDTATTILLVFEAGSRERNDSVIPRRRLFELHQGGNTQKSPQKWPV